MLHPCNEKVSSNSISIASMNSTRSLYFIFPQIISSYFSLYWVNSYKKSILPINSQLFYSANNQLALVDSLLENIQLVKIAKKLDKSLFMLYLAYEQRSFS